MKRFLTVLTLCVAVLFPVHAFAGHSHYTNGVEGIKAGSLPPEGFYWRMYNVYYQADKMKDNYKNSNDDFDVDVFAWVNRFIWTTPFKILGADLTMDLVVPMVYTDIKMDGAFSSNRFGLGDILVEPLVLHWHGERWDSALGVGLYLPTGEFAKNENESRSSPGKGYYTMMFSGGGTIYLDAPKTWSVSLLARYEQHLGKQRHTRVNPGEDFHFEWGIGKMLPCGLEVGIAGYDQWQLHRDKGGKTPHMGTEQAHAIGPELGYTIVPWGLTITARSLWEYENKSTSQGNITSLVFTKAF